LYFNCVPCACLPQSRALRTHFVCAGCRDVGNGRRGDEDDDVKIKKTAKFRRRRGRRRRRRKVYSKLTQ